MKRTTFIILLLVAMTGITADIFAQRAIGGRRLVLDDGAGNVVTLDNYNRGLLIGTGGPAGIDPTSSAMLAVDGLGTGGITPGLTSPRGVLFAPMSTAQRNSIVAPANGLLVYNTSTNTYDVFAGGSWQAISGWTLVGNTIAPGGGGTGPAQNFLGSLNAQDVVIATNVGAPGSGAGERMRITSAGQVGISAMNSPFTPLTDVHIDGTNGTANVRLNSLGGAPLLVPALNLAADGITIAGGMGDLLKYDVATVVGSVAWLRTGNNIVDGNNLFGTVAGSATTDVQMQTNGLPVMYLDGATQFVGVGNSTPAYTLDVTGTLGSSGNSDIGTDVGTFNTFGNNSANTNQIGTGAQFNYIGDNATNFNSFGYNAALNDFGGNNVAFGTQSNYIGQVDGAFGALTNNLGTVDAAASFGASTNNIGSAEAAFAVTTNNIGGAVNSFAVTTTNIGAASGFSTTSTNNIGAVGTTTNTFGSGTASTNTIQGTTNINVGVNSNTNINTAGTGAVGIGNSNSVTINSSANDVTINTDAGNTVNDLVLTGIDAPNANFDILTINNAGDVNAVGRATGTALTQQGISFDNEASGTRIRMGSLTAGNGAALYPFLANRFVNLDAFTVSFNRGAGTDNMLSLNGATDVVTIEGTTNINVSHNTATNINTGTSTSNVAIGNAGAGSGAVSITSGRTVAAGDVTIATVDNAGVGADLVLNGIETESPMTGNVLWLTNPGNEVRKSITSDLAEQGITWKLEGGALRVRLGALDGDPVPTNALLANRNVYLGGFRLNISDNTGASYLSLNDAANTTQLGVAGGTANTVTGTSNTVTATGANTITAGTSNAMTAATTNTITSNGAGGNTVNATAGPNAITASTSNTITAGTSNTITAGTSNTITAGTSNAMTAATTNTITSNGAGGNIVNATAGPNAITASTSNTITAGTSNAMTAATTNTITSNGAGGNIVNATAGPNAITASTSNTITAGTSNAMTAATTNTITSNGAGGNIVNATAGPNAITASTSNTITAGTTNAITSNNGFTNITANAGDILLDVDGAASGNDIRMVGVDAAVPANTDRALFLNATNDVRTRTFTTLADQGLQYDGTAFMLGAIPAGTNPITTARTVRMTGAGSLTFDNGTGNLLALGTNSIAEGNATATYGLTSNEFNVNSATGALSDASGDVLLADNIDMQNNLVLNIGHANTDFTAGGGLNLNGVLDGAAAGNELGATTSARQLTVLGVADAIVGNTIAGNPTVWDLVVTGDLGVTGIAKFGGSLWLDAVSATHNIQANAPLNITTTAGNNMALMSGSNITLTPSGGGNVTVTAANVLPSVNLTQALGSAGARWDVFADEVNANSLVLPPMTVGSVLFIGAGGQMTQDNANFFWDDAFNRLGIGTTAPSDQLHVNGTSRFGNAATFDNTMTTTGTHTANGSSLLQGSVTINGQLTVNNLVIDATNDHIMVTGNSAGGVVETRQVSQLPFPGGVIPITSQALAAPYNILPADYLVITTNAAAGNVVLPAASAGKVYVVKSRGAGAVTVTAAGGALIDGAANHVLAAINQTRTFASDGVNWVIIGF